MTYDDFRRTVDSMMEEIPDEFLEGLQGVHVLEEARPEPDFKHVYRLGEYMDPGPRHFLGSSDGLGRHVALYYGSFKAIAGGNPSFDWEGEIWETLTHELRHHVESLAGDGQLIEEDRRRNETFKRKGR
ncbi:MAG: metallopeptidase family protein [Deinococcota bacterium]|nr:metallopeptidase family protein [Deinococcota bacterium]